MRRKKEEEGDDARGARGRTEKYANESGRGGTLKKEKDR